MIRLAIGARVEVAFIVTYGNRSEGLVLAETATDWVTWHVYQTPDPEVWDAQAGHYFRKDKADPGAVRQEAERNFGKRLSHILTANAYDGLKESCEP